MNCIKAIAIIILLSIGANALAHTIDPNEIVNNDSFEDSDTLNGTNDSTGYCRTIQ